MTVLRRFTPSDLFKYNQVNLDRLTETYHTNFYFHYFVNWPNLCHISESPSGDVTGYIVGKVEGTGKRHKGHVTAVTVSPEYRRIGQASTLMKVLETISDKVYNGYFVDLYVRASNTVAFDMYSKMDYHLFRRVLNYYSGEEDGLDLRKALSRDVNKESIVPLGRDVTDEDDFGD
ncbi:n-alpha-acetyltransferase 20 [Anaeramoeba flamelloides]|uniref:N-alpha-acetyltransferase n=1 Tax=Anaeramoeba flamelloides TaxID=1746091 RepID=A0AAV7ZE30_9EUKA|nr:n-alpha-acetyltransferase [Anaeramoeba flamelloides]KAJ6227743.1 n-alpha-acetyltransferase 20 [Anaeramoeba flamelloides]